MIKSGACARMSGCIVWAAVIDFARFDTISDSLTSSQLGSRLLPVYLRRLSVGLNSSKTFRRDIYGLRAPGFLIEMVEPPVPDPLAVAQYSCLYWVDHLLNCDKGYTTNDLKDGGSVH